MNSLFRQVAQFSADLMASAGVFLVAVMIIIVWIVTGPMYGYSDTWQLVIIRERR